MKTEQNNGTESFKITGDWKGQSNLLKSKYAQLTTKDLTLEPGKENDLLKRMAYKLNKNQDEIISILKRTRSESLVQ